MELTCECNGKVYKNNTTLREHRISKAHKDWEFKNNNKVIEELNKKHELLILENEELKRELIKVKNSYLSILYDFNKY
jgi:hypothetical protein